MPVTTYTYSIASDFPGGKMFPSNLVNEIRASSIVTAIDHVSTSGDAASIVFKDALSAGDKTKLDNNATGPAGGLIAAHNSAPPIQPLGLQFLDANGTNKPATFDPSGRMLFSSVKPTFTKDNRISFNWCDKTSWYEGSTQSAAGETLTDSGDHLSFGSAHTNWIDMTHGKVWQEDALVTSNSKWSVTVKVNGTTKTQHSPGATDHDYGVNFATGTVTFLASQSGNTVTATYWYANSSVFTIKPLAGQRMNISRVELQFSDDINLLDTTVFTEYGFVQVFAPQYSPNPYPSGTEIPLGSLYYKSMSDFFSESNGAYPLIPILSITSGNWRGINKQIVTLAWDYLAGTDLYSSMGMYLQVSLANNVAHGGTYCTSTFYATTQAE